MLAMLTVHYGTIEPLPERGCAGAAISIAGWHDLWDYSFDDHALLCDLRSQPCDSGWHVVSLPLCDDGNGFA